MLPTCPRGQKLHRSQQAYPPLFLRVGMLAFCVCTGQKSLLMALLMNIKDQAMHPLRHAVLQLLSFCWCKETRPATWCWSSAAILYSSFSLRFYIVSLLTCKFLRSLEEGTEAPKYFTIFKKSIQIVIFTIPALASCKMAMIWNNVKRFSNTETSWWDIFVCWRKVRHQYFNSILQMHWMTNVVCFLTPLIFLVCHLQHQE